MGERGVWLVPRRCTHLRFHHEEVVLRPQLHFLQKMVSHFHLLQYIVLPDCFPSPTFSDKKALFVLFEGGEGGIHTYLYAAPVHPKGK